MTFSTLVVLESLNVFTCAKKTGRAHHNCTQKAARELDIGQSQKPSKPIPSDIAPPARLLLLKPLLPPQTAPPSGNKVFKYINL